VTSSEKLSIALNLSNFKIKNAIKKLSDTGYIKIETTNKFTKIKLLDSVIYKSFPFEKQKQTEQLPTIRPKTNHKQTDITNKENKENKEKESEERKKVFKTEIFKFSNSFSQEHLESFYNYWCQENNQTGRLKFEDEMYWNLEFKIKNWVNYPNSVSKSAVGRKFIKNRPNGK
jgi:DNA-binding transcriptional MocR family regulator